MVQETCQWYVSPEKPECGLPAVAKVRVKGRVTKATVYLCADHKATHDRNFAELRTDSAHSH